MDTCKRTAIVTNRTPDTGQNNTPMNKDKKTKPWEDSDTTKMKTKKEKNQLPSVYYLNFVH